VDVLDCPELANSLASSGIAFYIFIYLACQIEFGEGVMTKEGVE